MLQARDLTKSFGALKVTRSVSLTIRQGERHAIIGPNGAGKTTLFNLLTGELKPDGGHIILDGTDITGLPPDRRARLGLGRSFQRNSLFAGLTVRESLILAVQIACRRTGVFWRDASRSPKFRAQVEATAERVGLAAVLDEIADGLPYGCKRQLEVGLALASRPKVLLLDEPTSGVGPEETDLILRLLLELPPDLALIIVEHDMDLVHSLADRVTVLEAGSIVFEGTPEEARESALVREIYLGEFSGHA